jgi:hypothetical protein
VEKLRSWWRGPAESPGRATERARLEDERETIKTSQLGLGRGPTPSTLPPTPDTIHPDR